MSLKGTKMEDYFLNELPILTKSEILNPKCNGNKLVYYLCLYLQTIINQDNLDQIIKDKLSSVQIIDKLANDDYDKLLTNSVVFLNLVDVSAANTIIECIVRETPILVNRHPALEEYLGKDYPLFYDDLNSVSDILNKDKIMETHLYLKNKDKDFLKIENFLSELIKF
ncbi:hypothetical protein MEO93_27020 [Dolichospermum sp. ST_sed3]|nr:hypothetical protein [Dolichospermum sp. ST_sed3]